MKGGNDNFATTPTGCMVTVDDNLSGYLNIHTMWEFPNTKEQPPKTVKMRETRFNTNCIQTLGKSLNQTLPLEV